MAVTVSVLADALRLDSSNTKEAAQLQRLLNFAVTEVDRIADSAPETAKDEAVIRVVGYLYDMPSFNAAVQRNALNNSGAAAILMPYRSHGAGFIGAAPGQATPSTGGVTPSGDGLTDEQVIALIQARVWDWAEAGNETAIPASKLILAPTGTGGPGGGVDTAARQAAAAAAAAAQANANKLMPPSPQEAARGTATSIRGWTASLIRTLVEAIVPNWARSGDSTPIPANKLTLAPSGSGTGGPAVVADGSITTSKLADDAVSSRKIQDGAVTTALIADDAVTGAKIPSGEIDQTHLDADSVGNTELRADAVDTPEVTDDAITEPKLAPGVRTKLNRDTNIGPALTAYLRENPLSIPEGTRFPVPEDLRVRAAWGSSAESVLGPSLTASDLMDIGAVSDALTVPTHRFSRSTTMGYLWIWVGGPGAEGYYELTNFQIGGADVPITNRNYQYPDEGVIYLGSSIGRGTLWRSMQPLVLRGAESVVGEAITFTPRGDRVLGTRQVFDWAEQAKNVNIPAGKMIPALFRTLTEAPLDQFNQAFNVDVGSNANTDEVTATVQGAVIDGRVGVTAADDQFRTSLAISAIMVDGGMPTDIEFQMLGPVGGTENNPVFGILGSQHVSLRNPEQTIHFGDWMRARMPPSNIQGDNQLRWQLRVTTPGRFRCTVTLSDTRFHTSRPLGEEYVEAIVNPLVSHEAQDRKEADAVLAASIAAAPRSPFATVTLNPRGIPGVALPDHLDVILSGRQTDKTISGAALVLAGETLSLSADTPVSQIASPNSASASAGLLRFDINAANKMAFETNTAATVDYAIATLTLTFSDASTETENIALAVNNDGFVAPATDANVERVFAQGRSGTLRPGQQFVAATIQASELTANEVVLVIVRYDLSVPQRTQTIFEVHDGSNSYAVTSSQLSGVIQRLQVFGYMVPSVPAPLEVRYSISGTAQNGAARSTTSLTVFKGV